MMDELIAVLVGFIGATLFLILCAIIGGLIHV